VASQEYSRWTPESQVQTWFRSISSLGFEIGLCLQVGNRESLHVVPYQGERDHQWQQPAPVVVKEIGQFAPRCAIEPIREVPEDVLQDVHVPPGRGHHLEGTHELRLVGLV
jgi:hypothetical protein